MRGSAVVGATFANRYTDGTVNRSPSVSLTTPTYDSSGVTTEPTWRLKPSWVTATGTDLLAHNPLTSGSDAVENPSILISNDSGATWTTPPGVTNPIAPRISPGHNADCFLFCDPNVNRLVMLWQQDARSDAPNQNGVWYSICTDPALVTWTSPTQLISSNNGSQVLEPKVLWDRPRSRHVLFTVADSGSAQVLQMRAGGSNPLSGYGTATTCNLPIPNGQMVWHPDVIQDPSGRFVMAFCDSYTSGSLQRQIWLASSWNGLNWRVAPRPLMKANSWATNGIYRPSIQPARAGAGYDMIVARHQTPDARLGIVRNIPASEVP